MVSDTLALLIYILVNVFIKVILSGSRAAHTGSRCAGSSDEAKKFLSPITFKHLKVVVRT